VLQRVEKSAAASNPQDWHYFVAGRQIGSLTNNNDLNTSYGDVIYHRSWAQGTGPFAYGDTAGLPGGDFDQSYDAIRPGVGGWADGDYTATGGETLAQVADTLWGDAGLWYLLAQANGLGGDGGNCERTAGLRAVRVETVVGRRVRHHEQQPDHRWTIGETAEGAGNLQIRGSEGTGHRKRATSAVCRRFRPYSPRARSPRWW